MKLMIKRAFILATLLVTSVHADKLEEAPAGSFTIAVIPDTQQYERTGKEDESDSVTNPTFVSIVDWIVDNQERQRIAFVSHVGDVVDVNNDEQWTEARRCMDRLHGKVPYGISVGNHDMTNGGDSSLFQRYFPKSHFASLPWYGGCFEVPTNRAAYSGNNANSFQLFSAEGMDFVALHLECNAPDDVLLWADAVLSKHSDRRAFITTHMDLGPRDFPKTESDFSDAPKGRMTWTKCHDARGNSAQQMWDKCFRRHANVFMICCGDQSRTQALHQTVRGDQGNTVHELLSDYGRSGLRVMRFVPSADRIEVRTWNPLKKELCESTKIVPDRSQHQFELTYVMTKRTR